MSDGQPFAHHFSYEIEAQSTHSDLIQSELLVLNRYDVSLIQASSKSFGTVAYQAV